jgi:hypothetical protein
MSASLARIIANANQEKTIEDAHASFIVNLADEIRARLTDSVALTALCDELEGASRALAKEITGYEPSEDVAPENVERVEPEGDVSKASTQDPGAANAQTKAYSGGAFVMPSEGQESEVPADEAIPGEGEKPAEPDKA